MRHRTNFSLEWGLFDTAYIDCHRKSSLPYVSTHFEEERYISQHVTTHIHHANYTISEVICKGHELQPLGSDHPADGCVYYNASTQNLPASNALNFPLLRRAFNFPCYFRILRHSATVSVSILRYQLSDMMPLIDFNKF